MNEFSVNLVGSEVNAVEKSEFIRENSRNSAQSVTFSRFSSVFTGQLTENTKRAYMNDIKEFFGVKELNDITVHQLTSVTTATANQFAEHLAKKGRAVSTINRKMTSMSALYTFLCRREVGIMDYNPFSVKEGAGRIRQSKRYSNTRALTKEEVQKVVRVTMEGTDLEAIRNRIIVLVLATTGLRRSEICRIKVGEIRKTHGKDVVEIVGKGQKERLIVISKSIKVLIDNYLEMRGLTYADKDKYLFVKHTSNAKYFSDDPDKQALTTQSIYNVVKKVAEKAGIGADDVSPHCMRHTWFTEALEMGLPIQDVADMGGHSDISTTRRYDHTNRVVSNNPADKLAEMFMEGE